MPVKLSTTLKNLESLESHINSRLILELLTFFFPYVRDWLNEHPFKNELNASVICNLNTGAPMRADVLNDIMKQLKGRMIRLLQSEKITDVEEVRILQHLLKTKKWNPYITRQ